jgi:quercetin dioxygenase-like cupin family protein
MMTRFRISFFVFVLIAGVSICLAQATKNKRRAMAPDKQHDRHVITNPGEVKFGPPPPFIPPGAEVAVLSGDPSKPGVSYTIRAKFPDGYKIPAHWHPTDENVSVVQGTFVIGMGSKWDETAGREMPAGSYALMPKGVRHFAWTRGETIVDVYGIGPLAFTYVNPQDDPRNKGK